MKERDAAVDEVVFLEPVSRDGGGADRFCLCRRDSLNHILGDFC